MADHGGAPNLPTDAALVARADEVRRRAHAPYSGFRVGAALVDADGAVIAACNVENASYGLSICAERAAVARAVAEGRTDPRRLVVVSETSPPAPPCGMCLQTLAEFGDDLDIVLANPRGERVAVRLEELLPFRFRPDMLGRKPPA